MAHDPFEAFGREFKRAMEEHGRLLNEEMKRLQEQLGPAMQLMQSEMQRIGAALERAMEEFNLQSSRGANVYEASMKAVAADRTSRRVKPSPKSERKRRPRRGFEGGEPVPVEPRPKPKPLMDGAEAPIE